ncbi:hypothetical protein DFH09DRAFT_1183289, partial [Mycena vulgaris]
GELERDCEQEGEDGTRRRASSDPGGDCGGGSSLRLEREERRGAGQEEEADVEGGAKAGGGARPVGAPGDLSGEGSQPRIGCDVMDGEARARCHRRGLEGGCGHGWRGARGEGWGRERICGEMRARAGGGGCEQGGKRGELESGTANSHLGRMRGLRNRGQRRRTAIRCEGHASPSAAHILMQVIRKSGRILFDVVAITILGNNDPYIATPSIAL